MATSSALFIPVSEISPAMENWCVNVQIKRIWTIPYCCDVTRILSVEMVFMDAQVWHVWGIQASVSRDLLKLKKLDLEEGGFYYVSSVLVVPNDGKDRTTRHGFRMVFERRTKMVKVESQTYIKCGLSPLTCTNILIRRKETEYLVDKVGLLTSMSCEREYTKDDKDLLAVYLEITDPMGKVECVVYDNYVQDVLDFLRSNGPCTPIIVVQYARIVHDAQILFGDVGIETVEHVSRLIFNPKLPDAFDMREWLVLSGVCIDGKIQFKNMDMPSISLRDEFLYFYHKKDIGGLNKQGKGGCFVICAKIISLVDEEAWWYSACRPHACSSMGSSIYICDGNFSVIPKYSVKVEVTDGKENPNSKEHPEIFYCLVGMRLMFVVETKSFCDVQEGCFKVLRTCGDKELVTMFLKDHFFRADRK
ncbi:Nucleic acid-binding, OB-fold, partial [Sesbania bispinosa]